MQTPDSNTLNPDSILLTEADWTQLLSGMVDPDLKKDYRRRTQRFAVNWDAKCTFTDEGQILSRHGLVLDTSVEGLTIRTQFEINADMIVRIEINPEGTPFLLKGRVIHCTETIGGFKIGLHLMFA